MEMGGKAGIWVECVDLNKTYKEKKLELIFMLQTFNICDKSTH